MTRHVRFAVSQVRSGSQYTYRTIGFYAFRRHCIARATLMQIFICANIVHDLQTLCLRRSRTSMSERSRYVCRSVAREAVSASASKPGRCPVCGRERVLMELDHKQPISRLGRNSPDNVWLICKECNRRKGRRTLFEFLRDEGIALRVDHGQALMRGGSNA